MNETQFLMGMLDWVREKTLDTIAKISELPDSAAALAWRPAPGRAHLGWQLMHIGVTEDGYLHKRILNKPPLRPDLAERFGGGSVPADTAPGLGEIVEIMTANRSRLSSFISETDAARLDQKPFPDAPRTLRQSLMLLVWHEAHHQGQAHLTLNLFKAAHGIK